MAKNLIKNQIKYILFRRLKIGGSNECWENALFFNRPPHEDDLTWDPDRMEADRQSGDYNRAIHLFARISPASNFCHRFFRALSQSFPPSQKKVWVPQKWSTARSPQSSPTKPQVRLHRRRRWVLLLPPCEGIWPPIFMSSIQPSQKRATRIPPHWGHALDISVALIFAMTMNLHLCDAMLLIIFTLFTSILVCLHRAHHTVLRLSRPKSLRCVSHFPATQLWCSALRVPWDNVFFCRIIHG